MQLSMPSYAYFCCCVS